MIEDRIIYDDYWQRVQEKQKEIDKLRTYRIVVEYLQDKLMHSNIPIEHVCYIMSILSYAEDGECVNDSFFYEDRLLNKNLKRALEVF